VRLGVERGREGRRHLLGAGVTEPLSERLDAIGGYFKACCCVMATERDEDVAACCEGVVHRKPLWGAR
jgi:hypothetical protein